jgi:hypothetical protein
LAKTTIETGTTGTGTTGTGWKAAVTGVMVMATGGGTVVDVTADTTECKQPKPEAIQEKGESGVAMLTLLFSSKAGNDW